MRYNVRVRSIFALGAAMLVWAPPGGAQERLGANRAASVMPFFESWSFGDGLGHVTASGDRIRLSSATQLSVPVSASVLFGQRWQLGLTGAFASSTVKLDVADPTLRLTEYSLSGLTDLKVSLTAHLIPDQVMVTVGVNAPTGTTELDGEELEAARILGAPALGLQVPALGTGTAGTAGIILARQLGGWAWAAAGSYEYRGTYAPIVLSAGIPTPDFNPSDAAHLSLNGDGLIGQHGMSIGVGVDFYSKDNLEFGGRGDESTTQLGPIITADWQLRLASARFRELTLFVSDRFRTEYKSAGRTVAGSSGNYFDAGIAGVLAAGTRTGIVGGLTLRHQTGLDSDDTIASAAATLGIVTLGLAYDVGNYSLRPFVRGQFGQLDSGGQSVSATGVGAGVVFGLRY
jgi:hypothetical protein